MDSVNLRNPAQHRDMTFWRLPRGSRWRLEAAGLEAPIRIDVPLNAPWTKDQEYVYRTN